MASELSEPPCHELEEDDDMNDSEANASHDSPKIALTNANYITLYPSALVLNQHPVSYYSRYISGHQTPNHVVNIVESCPQMGSYWQPLSVCHHASHLHTKFD